MEFGLYAIVFIMAVALSVFGVANFYQWILYFLEKSEKASKKYFFYGLLSMLAIPTYMVYMLGKLDYSLINELAIFIFIFSSLIGLSIFILFANFLLDKKIKNTLITLLMGNVVFIFFAPSAYFTFAPFFKDHYENRDRVAMGVLQRCNERSDDYDCMQMAKFYIEGDGVEQNYFKAIELYKKSSDANSSFASYELGVLYEEGEILVQDFKHSTDYYKKSCQLHSTKGCLKLAANYAIGRGVEKDVEQAEALYFKHCIAGTKDACLSYLDIHESKSVMSYTTAKEFNGKLEDDPSNWSRAFSTSLPKNILILKSLFKSSSGLCCTKYSFYFKVKMSKKSLNIALSKLEIMKPKKVETMKNVFPKNFRLESLENYRAYKAGDVSILVHKETNIIYIYDDVYIDGR